jgi:hypothetical protein
MTQIYTRRKNETDDEFFRRTFLAFAHEKLIESGKTKEQSKKSCDFLAKQYDDRIEEVGN